MTIPNAKSVKDYLLSLSDAAHKVKALRFFKSGQGDYAAADQFIGIRMPVLRQAVARFYPLPMNVILSLLKSPIHEVRLFALLMLVKMSELGSEAEQKDIAQIYLDNLASVNNWDLVDASCYKILGPYLFHSDSSRKDKSVLFELAKSESLWERRVAIVTTFYFIRQDDFETTLKLTDVLIKDKEDLIHKACGWMLRDVGNRDGHLLRQFLASRYKNMPRTMLRYAIEKFPRDERNDYLQGVK